MSARLALPLNQQRHSNVSVVRLKTKGHRFEIACYKNKVLAMRSGEEKDLDEVVQIERVFTSVNQGEYASKALLAEVFGTEMSERDILKHILLHGEVQVAELERSVEAQKLWNTIATFVSDHCVHPVSKRKYAVSLIEAAMKDMGYAPKLDQAAKPQALHLIRLLCSSQLLPICRAQMRVRICGPPSLAQVLHGCGSEPQLVVEKSEAITPVEWSYDVLLDTQLFRAVESAVRDVVGGSVLVLSQAVTAEGDGAVEEACVTVTASACPHEDGPADHTAPDVPAKTKKKKSQTKQSAPEDGVAGTSGSTTPAESAERLSLGRAGKKAIKDLESTKEDAQDDSDDAKAKGRRHRRHHTSNPTSNTTVAAVVTKKAEEDEEDFVSNRKTKKKGAKNPASVTNNEVHSDDDMLNYGSDVDDGSYDTFYVKEAEDGASGTL